MQALFQVLIAFDQLLNTLLGGQADETLSARAHRMRMKRHKWWGWTARAIDLLFFWQKEHCKTAYESELQRAHLPRYYQAAQAEKDASHG
jgi:hypothetical protein